MKKAVFLLFVLIAGSLLLNSQASVEELKKADLKSVNPQVKLQTEMGDIVVELYADKAPITVDNFIKNTNNYHYDGLIFHRVISGFMIQTGGHTFDLTFRESGREAIINESNNGLSNLRGTLAMARPTQPDSAKAQFFINHKDNSRLNRSASNPGYAVFGAVISGMEVVDAIAAVKVKNVSFYQNVPETPIRILRARLLNPKSWVLLPEPKKMPAYEIPVPIQ